ncbi:Asp-tRNA(Asn)/Glu-tRNA(Gln) amidotransferase subunit GatC [Gudongella sp. DL1XJH-153]|uniref:Asp-tRNA(Asn)/Glu-tRNA(Gln) amidotransferase subunit GatC n=1 Tax=Gudongella sp. DL1XJH-153 TaxID=3409804 RepID=UPI003BB6370D
MITRDQVVHISSISKLKFTDEELDEFTEKFDQVIGFLEKIKEVDTENVEPTFTINDEDGIMKENGESQTLSREEVLENTVESQYGYFKILKVVE